MAATLTERVNDRIHARVLSYALSRFHVVRKAHRFVEGQRQNLGLNAKAQLQPFPTTIFPDLSIDDCLDNLRQDGLSLGLRLPAHVVTEICDFAADTLCLNNGDGQSFMAQDVQNGRLPDGQLAARGSVVDPMDCPAVDALVRDPVLLEIAHRYLGYRTKGPGPRLYWFFHSDLPRDERPGQSCHYHYDVDGYGFLTIFFYLSQTDRNSGAHVVMTGTHKRKPLRMLLTPTVGRSDEEILDRFGSDREVVIEGPAGYGFLEDTSCYHKALAPRDSTRLMLQVAYR